MQQSLPIRLAGKLKYKTIEIAGLYKLLNI